MKIQTKITLNEYKRANLDLLLKRPTQILAILLVGVILLWFMFVTRKENPISQFVIPVILVFIYIQFYYKFKINWRKTYENNNQIQELVTYEFTPEKLQVTGETFNSQHEWKKINKIQSTKNNIFIYNTTNTLFIIPTHYFGEQLPAFKKLVKSKVVRCNF